MLNKALNIAYKAHIGQLDKGGSPYILHPVRVALHCQTEDEKIVALLHDVVEDTSITFEDLKTEGLDDRLLEALKCLIKEEGEDYKAFIERVSTNRLATKVKIQDLKDNMDVTRLNGKAHWKLETYKEALEYLERCSNKKVLYVGREIISPLKCKVKPSLSAGPIINRADIYWELTFPFKVISFPFNSAPLIHKGGYPSWWTYSISAPNSRSALTNICIGRCCIRAVPVIVRSPGVTLK